MYRTMHIFTNPGRENFLGVVKGLTHYGFQFASAKSLETSVGLQVTVVAQYCASDPMDALNEFVKILPHGSRILVDQANPLH